MTIHLIRHGQSEFNAAFTGTGDPMIHDAPLTQLGISQAENARATVQALGIAHVICSPLTRAIQTARLIFPDHSLTVEAEAREHCGHSCDVGAHPETLKTRFPDMVFDHLPDIWWHQGPRNDNDIPVEPWEVFSARVQAYVQDLHSRDARPLAVVCHGHVIREMTGIDPNNCDIVPLIP